jgi:[protein-PII] uridylyltransferase
VHRYTVDRHLLEAAAEASARSREVDRPDLLLIGAFLHDLGKGYPGDHCAVGAEHARTVATRMGFDAADVDMVTALVRHHLLLPDTATRRDLDDPVTIASVAEAVGGSVRLLDGLHTLALADAAATGPGAWSDWKGGLVRQLVSRTRAVLAGEPPPAPPPLDDDRRRLAEARTLAVTYRGDEVLVAARDSVGVLYRTAGILALHSLDVRSASIATVDGMAVNSFVVQPRFGTLPDPALLRADLSRALEGDFPLADRLRAKERAYARRERSARPPTVTWFDDAATDATVIEIRAEDSIGLLCRLTAAFHRSGVDVRSALVSSLGGSAVDAFYVTTRDGRPIPREARGDIEIELRTI